MRLRCGPRLPGPARDLRSQGRESRDAQGPARPAGRSSAFLRAACALALVAGAFPALAAPPLGLSTSGGLTATADGGIASGSFGLSSSVRDDGTESVRATADATNLNVTRGESGAVPEFRVFLVPPSGEAADLGAMRVNVRGEARFRAPRAAELLGGRTLRDFENGTIEIRRAGTAVLSATVRRLTLERAGTWESKRRVWGDFVAVDKPRRSPGSFRLDSVSYGTGARADRITIVSPKIETDGNPDYRGYILDRNLTRVVALGTLKRELRFGARLVLDQSAAALPGGILAVTEFDHGRVEVRQGTTTVLLRGYVPGFPVLTEPCLPQRSAASRGAEELLPPGGGAARALAEARMTISETRRVQSFQIRALGLDAAAGPFGVTAIDDSGTRTELGTFAASGARGAGRIVVSTARGGELPGGLPWLSAQSLEVRTALGAVALSGRMPTIR